MDPPKGKILTIDLVENRHNTIKNHEFKKNGSRALRVTARRILPEAKI